MEDAALPYHRLFARAFGQTPHEFLTQLRIEEAKRLLALDQLAISQSGWPFTVCLQA
ncbi:MAG: hypothetical protein ACR2NN_15000 [Bryobacteraceae bacterium]